MRTYFTLLLIVVVLTGSAQSEILGAERELAAAFQKMRAADSDESRRAASDDFKSLLLDALDDSRSFDYPFESLPMCKLTSPDGAFRLFNWNVPMDDGSHIYEAMMMIESGKEAYETIELKDDSERISRPARKKLGADDWYGALYFRIIPLSKRSKEYLLLAWDGADALTNRKIIEVLRIQGKKPVFGSPIFKQKERGLRRVFLDYPEDIVLSLVYDERNERLVFDHMAPPRPELEGRYEFYSPDSSYDAYWLEQGKLRLENNVEFNRQREPKDKDFYDPRVK